MHSTKCECPYTIGVSETCTYQGQQSAVCTALIKSLKASFSAAPLVLAAPSASAAWAAFRLAGTFGANFTCSKVVMTFRCADRARLKWLHLAGHCWQQSAFDCSYLAAPAPATCSRPSSACACSSFRLRRSSYRTLQRPWRTSSGLRLAL